MIVQGNLWKMICTIFFSAHTHTFIIFTVVHNNQSSITKNLVCVMVCKTIIVTLALCVWFSANVRAHQITKGSFSEKLPMLSSWSQLKLYRKRNHKIHRLSSISLTNITTVYTNMEMRRSLQVTKKCVKNNKSVHSFLFVRGQFNVHYHHQHNHNNEQRQQ